MRENSKLRDYNPMTVLSIPDIVVRNPVHVDPEPTVGVEIHVGNEK